MSDNFDSSMVAYHVTQLLNYIEPPEDGVPKYAIETDALREGLRETPSRVTKAMQTWFGGYYVDIPALLKVFSDGAEGYNDMVVRKGIPVYSHCEHHMAPIIGHATVAYIPQGKIVGLSKMDRLVDAFARRLQVQERLTKQIADTMVSYVSPDVAVFISARHMCVESRGVCNVNSDTVTQSLHGAFINDASTRAEFLALARS